jgi:hypothetical protein
MFPLRERFFLEYLEPQIIIESGKHSKMENNTYPIKAETWKFISLYDIKVVYSRLYG